MMQLQIFYHSTIFEMDRKIFVIDRNTDIFSIKSVTISHLLILFQLIHH